LWVLASFKIPEETADVVVGAQKSSWEVHVSAVRLDPQGSLTDVGLAQQSVKEKK